MVWVSLRRQAVPVSDSPHLPEEVPWANEVVVRLSRDSLVHTLQIPSSLGGPRLLRCQETTMSLPFLRPVAPDKLVFSSETKPGLGAP